MARRKVSTKADAEIATLTSEAVNSAIGEYFKAFPRHFGTADDWTPPGKSESVAILTIGRFPYDKQCIRLVPWKSCGIVANLDKVFDNAMLFNPKTDDTAKDLPSKADLKKAQAVIQKLLTGK
jgi:hypothetical protein